MIVWLNGALVTAEAARIDPRDRGLLLGDGLFETMLARNGRVLRLPAHRARLERSAAELGLPAPPFDWAEVCAALLAANGLVDAALRLTLTRGIGARGLAPPQPCRPTVLISAAPPADPAPPARLCVAQSTRRNAFSPTARLKTLNYLDGVVARREAAARGCDDAVLLDTRGRVAEATAANLFALVDGRRLTPPVADGALPGVVRAELLAAGAEEVTLTPAALASAEEIVLTNALGVRGVASLDGRPLPPGLLLAWAQAAFDAGAAGL